jgi:hypothetical protein
MGLVAVIQPIPPGGTDKQVLTKKGNEDYVIDWEYFEERGVAVFVQSDEPANMKLNDIWIKT